MWATRLPCPSCRQRCAPIVGRYRWWQGSAFGIWLAHEIPESPSAPLQRRQHAGENLEPQIFFVAQAVGAALDHPDLVIEPLDEAERDLVLKPAVGCDPIPMT